MSSSTYAPMGSFEGAVLSEVVSEERGRFPFLRVAFAAIILPQISTAFWWFQTHSAVHFRGWINSEYLILLAIAFLFPNWSMVGVLTAELTFALIEPISHLYYFSPEDAISSLRYLAYLPPYRLFAYTSGLFLYVLTCGLGLRFALKRRLPLTRMIAACLVIFAAVPATCDFIYGNLHVLGSLLGSHQSDVRSTRLSRAPIASLVGALYVSRTDHRKHEFVPLPSTLTRALGQLQTNTKPDVVLVLTESWGLAYDERINRAETEPYHNLAVTRDYKVETGTTAFNGPTTAGETRELCENSRGHLGLSDPSVDYSACWPAKLSIAGYQTFAVHGFTPTMFRRKSWYQRLGFAHSMFLPELERDGVPLCDGAFTGACDIGVANWIGVRLAEMRNSQPVFIHWVTLNSHLPLAAVTDDAARQNCAALGIAGGVSLCSWFNRVHDVQTSVARLATQPELRPTIFVIVGDHAPPFMEEATRSRFSQSSVPWVILVPRALASKALPNSTETAKARPIHPQLARVR